MRRSFILVVMLVVFITTNSLVVVADSESWLKAVVKGAIVYALAKPSDKDIALAGDELSLKFRNDCEVRRDIQVLDMARTIALAKKIRCPDVRIIDQKDESGEPVINAFAIPGSQGGYIYLTEGMVDFLKTKDPMGWKDDTAGVLGHEMGHIELKHAKSQYKHSLIGRLLMAVALEGAGANNTLSSAAEILEGLREAGYSRDQERGADDWGLEAAEAARFDPYALPRTFKLMREKDGDIPKYFLALASHPSLASREKRLNTKLNEGDETSGRLPAPVGVKSPSEINEPTKPLVQPVSPVRIVLIPKKIEGPMPAGGPEQFVAWINQGLIGSDITVVLRGEEYENALAEQSLPGVDPTTKVEPGKFWGATGEAAIIASCTDGYLEKAKSSSGGILMPGGSRSSYERKYFARTNGTITNFSFKTLAVTDVTESASYEAAVSGSNSEVHLPGIDVSTSQGGNVEQPVVDNAWRELASSLSRGLKAAFDRLPRQDKPAVASTASANTTYVVFRGAQSLKQSKIGQVFNAYSKAKPDRLVGNVEVVSFHDSADTAAYFHVNPSPVYRGFPIGKWTNWSGTAQDVQAGLIFTSQ